MTKTGFIFLFLCVVLYFLFYVVLYFVMDACLLCCVRFSFSVLSQQTDLIRSQYCVQVNWPPPMT